MQSTAVATQVGSSAHLLKVGSKRRRTKAEVEEFRAMQASQMDVIAARDARIEELQLSQWPAGSTVLDIGAGYGRFCHRAKQALPHLGAAYPDGAY